MSFTKKRYVSPNECQSLGLNLAHQIYETIKDFSPTRMITLWRGGSIFGLTVQGFLASKGIVVDHVSVRTSSYTAPGQQSTSILVDDLDYVVNKFNANDRVLIVDDVLESGRSLAAVLSEMNLRMRANMPTCVRIATAFWKPESNKTFLEPHYFAEKTSDWLVFGHEFEDVSQPGELHSVMGPEVAAAYYGVAVADDIVQ